MQTVEIVQNINYIKVANCDLNMSLLFQTDTQNK